MATMMNREVWAMWADRIIRGRVTGVEQRGRPDAPWYLYEITTEAGERFSVAQGSVYVTAAEAISACEDEVEYWQERIRELRSEERVV